MLVALAGAAVGAQTQPVATVANRVREARQMAASGHLDAAIQAVQKVLAGNPARYDALLLFGELLEARGDLAGAAGAYERAVRARSGSAVAHDKLGFVLGRQERI